MKRSSLPIVVLIAVVGCHSSSGDRGKTDAERIQGEWKFEVLTQNGEPAPLEFATKMKDAAKMVITANSIVVKMPEEKDHESSYTIDSIKNPKEIDLVPKEINEFRKRSASGSGSGSAEENTIKGIYSLDGDTLTICTPQPGDSRPTELASKKGSHLDLVVLKRAK